MNDLDLCLELVPRSRQPLLYIRRWISRKPLKLEAWFQRTTNRKQHNGLLMVTWPMTSRDSERCCEEVRSAILATARLLVCKTSMSIVAIRDGRADGVSLSLDNVRSSSVRLTQSFSVHWRNILNASLQTLHDWVSKFVLSLVLFQGILSLG